MKQLVGYLGAALLILLGARIQRPLEHAEPQPEPVIAAAPEPAVPAAPEGTPAADPNKPPRAPGSGG